MSYFEVSNWQRLPLSKVAAWVTLDGLITILLAGAVVPDSLARGFAEDNRAALASLCAAMSLLLDPNFGRLQVEDFHLQYTQFGGAQSFVQYVEEDSSVPADSIS